MFVKKGQIRGSQSMYNTPIISIMKRFFFLVHSIHLTQEACCRLESKGTNARPCVLFVSLFLEVGRFHESTTEYENFCSWVFFLYLFYLSSIIIIWGYRSWKSFFWHEEFYITLPKMAWSLVPTCSKVQNLYVVAICETETP